MNLEFQQYRFARIEAQNITRTRLETQFKHGVGDPHEFERAIERFVEMKSTCTPWRNSELEQAGSRDGARMAALEFFWMHRRQLPTAAESQ
jgi:hypothetical protein